jgi:hypothetical protein
VDGAAGTSGGGDAGGHHGEFTLRDGRKIRWSCTAGGKATVEGVEYDLAQGSLFLIAVRGDAPQVRQLAPDWAGARDAAAVQKRLRELAESDEAVKAFVKGAEAKKEP